MSDFEVSKPKDINEITKILGDAWLNINVDEKTLYNPLETIPAVWEDRPELYFTWLMSQPEYFSFVCKEVFNIQLLPMQSLILKEMWNRKFPMLIGARGLGKSFLLGLYALLRITFMRQRKVVIVGAAFRQSKVIFEYMETIWNNAPVLRSMCPESSGPKHEQDMWRFFLGDSVASALPLGDGTKIRGQRANDIINDEFACIGLDSLIQTDIGLIKIKDYIGSNAYELLNIDNQFEIPTKIFKTPKTDVYRITTQNGYFFDCSSIHQTMTNKGWKIAKDLQVGDKLELDINDYFPNDNININNVNLDEKLGWLMGILVSEGTVTNRNHIIISNTDYDLIERSKLNFPDFNWREYHKKPYKDGRGWNCKESWALQYNNTEFRTILKKMGIDYVTSHDKCIPSAILCSPRNIIISFLSGLYEGDGSAFNYYEHNKKRIGMSYYSVSEELIKQLQILLLKFNIISSKTKRKSNISKNDNWMLSVRGVYSKKLFDLLNVDKWKNKFDNADFLVKKPHIRQNGKRYIISTNRGNKNVHIGTFDTKKECEQAFDDYWNKTRPVIAVKSVELLKEKEHLYDFYMPETHSFCGNGFIQHNSTPREIFENVVAGFGSVSASPIENVIQMASEMLAEQMGYTIDKKADNDYYKSNQIILSGTAYYDFNHFAEYWKDWSTIIRTKGDPKRIQELFNRKAGSKRIEEAEVPADFDWTDYSVIRIPYELMPAGFMDAGQVARSKATIHAGIYEMEYGAVFSSDSNGFYKRSLIETCVGKPNEPISLPSGEVYFGAMIRGNSSMRYVYGIDPASEIDNFTIVIMEVHQDHHRIVYVWSTTRKDHREKVKSKLIQETDFYSYCCRQIRDLMKKFPCERIALDAQGGGIAVIEGLHDQDKIRVGELPIWPTIDLEKEKDTDGESGLHIVEMIQFASADWTSEANHGLRKDFEDKVTLFPHFDGLELSVAANKDAIMGRLYDTLEDCMLDIEELKDELSTIIISRTPNGRERWDTPEIKLPGNKKGRQRKDRYSSLLMANMVARQLVRDVVFQADITEGGFAGNGDVDGGPMFSGAAWFTEKIQGVY